MSSRGYNPIVIKLLELGKQLHENVGQVMPWADAGESWKRADDDTSETIDALQKEVIELIADSTTIDNLFLASPAGELNPLVIRILGIVAYRSLLSEWSSMSVTNLAHSVTMGDSIAERLDARRCVVDLCRRGILRFHSQGDVSQAIWIGKRLLEFIENGVALVVPQPVANTSRGKDSRGKPSVQTKPEDNP